MYLPKTNSCIVPVIILCFGTCSFCARSLPSLAAQLYGSQDELLRSLRLLHRPLPSHKSNQMRSIVRRVNRTRASFRSSRIQNVMRNFSPIESWTSSESRKVQVWLTLAPDRGGSLFGQRDMSETQASFMR